METSLPSGAPLRPILPDLDTVEDGMIFKQCVRDRVVDRMASNQQILASDEETEVQEMLAGFSSKERKRILRWGESSQPTHHHMHTPNLYTRSQTHTAHLHRKLAKMESKDESLDKHKKRRKKLKRKMRHHKRSSDSDEESSGRERRRKRSKHKKYKASNSSSSSEGKHIYSLKCSSSAVNHAV